MSTSNPVLAPYLALLLVPVKLCVRRTNFSPSPSYQDDVTQAVTYLELNLYNVLEAFGDLGLLESRSEAYKGRMRKDTPILGIKFPDRQCSDRVVVLA